jgi:O-antigen/teichoic acid export membrane protein
VLSSVRGMFGRDTLYTIGVSSQLLTAAIITPLLTRLAGARGFGAIAALLAVAQVLSAIECIGLNVGIQRIQMQSARLAAAAFGVCIISVVSCSVVFWLTAPYWSPPIGFGHSLPQLRVTIAWAAVGSVTLVGFGYLRAADRARTFVVAAAAQTIGCPLLGIILVTRSSDKPAAYMLGMLLGESVTLAVMLVALPPSFAWWKERRQLAALLLFSAPLAIQTLSTFVYSSSDRLVINRDLGSASVARYQVAYNLAAVGTLLVSVLTIMWVSRVIRALAADRRDLLRESRMQLLNLAGVVTVGLSVGAPAILKYWAPSDFHASGLVVVVALVALATLPSALYAISYQGLIAAGLTVFISAASVGSGALNLICNLVAVPLFGINGSAGATLLCYVALAVVAGVFAQRKADVPGLSVEEGVYCLIVLVLVGASTLLGINGLDEIVRWIIALGCLGWFSVEVQQLTTVGRTRLVTAAQQWSEGDRTLGVHGPAPARSAPPRPPRAAAPPAVGSDRAAAGGAAPGLEVAPLVAPGWAASGRHFRQAAPASPSSGAPAHFRRPRHLQPPPGAEPVADRADDEPGGER